MPSDGRGPGPRVLDLNGTTIDPVALDRRRAACFVCGHGSFAPRLVMSYAGRGTGGVRCFDSELVRAAVGAVPDGVVWVDGSGTIVLVNDAARSMFGCAHVNCPITACAELFGLETREGAPISPAEIPLARALIRHELVVDEACRIRRPGAVVDVLATATPLADDEGYPVGATLLLHEVDAPVASKHDLEQLVDFQRMLLAIVGHDLENPLTAILTGVRLLQTNGSPPTRDTAARIARSAERAKEIVSLLLDVPPAKTGGLPTNRREVSMAAIARDIVAEYAPSDGRSVVLETAGDTRTFADPVRMGQLLSNLVGNALDHGSPTTDVIVTVRGTRDAVEVAVENQTDDLSPVRSDMVFAPLRLGTAPSSTRCHLGLGLYIVRTIVEAHAGTVTVEASGGRVVFLVRLPREPDVAHHRRLELAH